MAEPSETESALPLAPMQLREVFPVTLVAKLNRVSAEQAQQAIQPAARLSGPTVLGGDSALYQVELGVKITSEQEPAIFEIEVTIVGVFERTNPLPEGYTPEMYLTQTSLALLLPFLREHIFEMSARLRVGPVLLPVVAPPTSLQAQEAPTQTAGAAPLDTPRADTPTPRSRRRPPRPSPATS